MRALFTFDNKKTVTCEFNPVQFLYFFNMNKLISGVSLGIFLYVSLSLLLVTRDVRGLDFEPCTEKYWCEYRHCDTKHSAANQIKCNEGKGGLCNCKYDDDFGADDYIRIAPENKWCKNQTSGDCFKACKDLSKTRDAYLCTARDGKKLCYCGRQRPAPETTNCYTASPDFFCQMANCDPKTAKMVTCEKEQSACLCRAAADGDPLKPDTTKCWKSTTPKCTNQCKDMDAWVCNGNKPGSHLCYCSKK